MTRPRTLAEEWQLFSDSVGLDQFAHTPETIEAIATAFYCGAAVAIKAIESAEDIPAPITSTHVDGILAEMTAALNRIRAAGQ